MLSEKLSGKIRAAAEEMSTEELLEFLQELEREGKIELYCDGWDYAVDFAQYLVKRMQEALNNGSWPGYEIRALYALEEIPCKENGVVEINAYGFPKEIENNDDLLWVLGVQQQLYSPTENRK